jgi:hypothetical protein
VNLSAYFQSLGEEVDGAWARSDFHPQALPGLAEAAIRLRDERPEVFELIRWAQTAPLPAQLFTEGRQFGQPPLTVYASPRLMIEVLFWLDGTTSIHQHGFSGAFQVLAGSSIQTRYDFRVECEVNPGFKLGQLEQESIELLETGAVCRIESGTGLIHAVFHLDRPSVTMVVRSILDEYARPQLQYSPPHLAHDPFQKKDLALRRMQALGVLMQTRPSQYLLAVAELLSTLDFESAFWLLEQCHGLLKEGDAFSRFLAQARERHGDKVDYLLPVFREKERQTRLIHKRQKVTQADLRFFLALLLNAHDRASVRAVIERRHPGTDWMELADHWLFDAPPGATPLAKELGGVEADRARVRACLSGGQPVEWLGPLSR